ncbi:MAG TPA: hypothetical protein VK111_03730 [Virgibacillus sp.]|nr:hypothetical protein [Virgibacillus sp.]
MEDYRLIPPFAGNVGIPLAGAGLPTNTTLCGNVGIPLAGAGLPIGITLLQEAGIPLFAACNAKVLYRLKNI